VRAHLVARTVIALTVLSASVLLGWIPRNAPAEAAVPTVTLRPSAGQTEIRTGDPIRVSWTGMPTGPVSIYQCLDPGYLSAQQPPLVVSESCLMSSRVVGQAGPDGSGSATFSVFWRIDSPRLQQVICLESSRCSIRVTSCPHLPEAGPNATLTDLPLGVSVLDEDGLPTPVNPPTRFQRPTPVLPTFTVPPPLPNITRPAVRAGGGTGADIAMQTWASESLATPAVGIDAQWAGRNISEAFDELLSGVKDFAVTAMPLRGDLAFPYATPLSLDPTLSAEDRAAALAAREQDRLDNLAKQAETNEAAKKVTYVPLIATPLDVVFDIAPFGVELEALNLDSRSLARMYSGGTTQVPTISTWRDPTIGAMNPGCPPVPRFSGNIVDGGLVQAVESSSGQPTPVRATSRSDVAEASYTLREWMGATNPDLAAALAVPSAESFRNAVGKNEVTGSDGVAQALSAASPSLVNPATAPTPGRVAYVEHPYAVKWANRVASVQNKAGNFVQPNLLTAAATMVAARTDPTTGLVAVNDDGSQPLAYPMVQIYYAAVTPDLLNRPPERIASVRDFLGLALSDQGQAAAARRGYVPLNQELRVFALQQLAKVGVNPSTTPPTTPSGPAQGPTGGSSSPSSVQGTSQTSDDAGTFGAGSFGGSFFGSPPSGSFGGSSSGSFSSGSFGSADSAEQLAEMEAGGSSGLDGESLDETGAADGDPGVVDSAIGAVARPVGAVLDVLANPGQSPGLFTIMVVGGICSILGPILTRRRGRAAGTAS